jgi:predicted DNA-binding WGR domain protein
MMNAVTLHRIDPSCSMRRYYRLDVQPDLFGFWLLVREWGRIGYSGQTRVVAFPTLDEAQAALQRQQRVKERRGYAPICPQ